MWRTVRALKCVCAAAALVLVTSVDRASGESQAIEFDEFLIELTTSSIAAPPPAPAVSEPAASEPVESEPAVSEPAVSELAEGERAADNSAANAVERIVLRAEKAIVGIASFYWDPQKTASGEEYDPEAFTAAAQLAIRDSFGGIQFGRLYRPAYGLGEYDGKKIIVRFNDVGPLRPGRKFDLSRAAMRYFDSTLDKGLLPGFKMTPLPLGRAYPVGPVSDLQLAALGIEHAAAEASSDKAEEQAVFRVAAALAKPASPAAESARPVESSSAVRLRAKHAKIARLAKLKKKHRAKLVQMHRAKRAAHSAKPAAAIERRPVKRRYAQAG